METWILLVVLLGTPDKSINQEFNTKDACIAARDKVVEDASSQECIFIDNKFSCDQKLVRRPKGTIECFKKGN